MAAQNEHSFRTYNPALNWRAALKRFLRPCFRIARTLLRPLLFRYRAYLLRPLQPMLETVDANSRQLAIVSQQLETISAALGISLSPRPEAIPPRADGLSPDLNVLRQSLTSNNRELNYQTENLEAADFLKSIDRLIVTLASRNVRN